MAKHSNHEDQPNRFEQFTAHPMVGIALFIVLAVALVVGLWWQDWRQGLIVTLVILLIGLAWKLYRRYGGGR
ncbi:MAG: hypothetical protein IIT36_05245 [Aeriscardovia sp.]|nr:hypothetical protein [Aeriscardovia sp.]